ncbi:hypothetical protein ACI2LF_31070 [Kribbella sp. NPDC020789]
MRIKPLLSLFAGAVTVLASTVLAPSGSSAAAVPDCALDLLPTLPGSIGTTVDAGDPGGRYQVGRSEDANGNYRLVRWTGDQPADLGPLGESVPTGAGYNGDVIGNAPAGDGWQGWRWRQGVRTALPTPAGFAGATAEAINDAGVIAGTAYDADGWNTRAVVWSADNQVRVLSTPAGFNNVKAADIDFDGTVAGTAEDWDVPNAHLREQKAVRWSPAGVIERVSQSGSSAKAIFNGQIAADVAGRPWVFLGYPTYNEVAVAATGPVRDIAVNSIRTMVLLGNRYNLQLVDIDRGPQRLPVEDPVVSGGAATVVTGALKVYGTDFARGLRTPVRWTCN